MNFGKFAYGWAGPPRGGGKYPAGPGIFFIILSVALRVGRQATLVAASDDSQGDSPVKAYYSS